MRSPSEKPSGNGQIGAYKVTRSDATFDRVEQVLESGVVPLEPLATCHRPQDVDQRQVEEALKFHYCATIAIRSITTRAVIPVIISLAESPLLHPLDAFVVDNSKSLAKRPLLSGRMMQ